jgi:hypothetical protein
MEILTITHDHVCYHYTSLTNLLLDSTQYVPSFIIDKTHSHFRCPRRLQLQLEGHVVISVTLDFGHSARSVTNEGESSDNWPVQWCFSF